MDKFNWKQELKRSFSGFGEDMWAMFCLSVVVALAAMMQTEKQLQSITIIIADLNWPVIILLLLGVLVGAALVDKLFRGIWGLVQFIWKISKKLKTKL